MVPRELASLLAQADTAVVQLTQSGEIITATDTLADQTGYTPETLRGKSLQSLLPTVPERLKTFLSGDSVATNATTAITVPLTITTANGDTAVFDGYFNRPSPDLDDGIIGTLHRRSEPPSTSMAASHPEWSGSHGTETAPAKAFAALADALPDGIIVLGADSEIQYANPAVERILGYTPHELVGGSKLSIIPARLRETHLQALNRYLETGERHIDWEYVELPGQHKSGHEVLLGISLNDFFVDEERYFVGLFRDISPRKEAEYALRDRERQLNQYKEYTDDILNAIDDVFYVVDADVSLQRWNQRVCEVTGYTDEEIASMHALEFFDEDDHESITNTIKEVFETGHARVEADLLTKDGTHVPYEFIAAALEDPAGNPVLAGIGRDITTRTEQRRKLEASNERLEQFAYAASHDLQEPLRMVTSYLQLIERRYRDELDTDGEEFIEFAVDGAERMREMIDGLLEYSRVETQGEPFEPVALDRVLEDVIDDLQLQIDESNAEISVEELPRVSGDRSQLRQVFQNLLSNAIEYSGDEPPAVEISAEREGSMWRLAVADSGIGIDPDDTDRIFQVFQRLHDRTEHSGTGLGLALTQRIVERHGGEIRVESEPGDGTTFVFTLPANAGNEP
ncbi:PAS domain-containing sensor histidine kinase [Natrialba asiatica]|nr:PAS domain S-box protein [Natrialba asiatica]